jgi:hypothetical protein
VTERMVTDPDELERVLVPYMRQRGYDVPQRGCYVAAVAFNDAGEVCGYQMLQNAIFAEGLDASDPHVSLRKLGAMVIEYATKELKAAQMMTLTRDDAQGERIGKHAMRMGFELMPQKIYRRRLTCQ